MTTGATGGPRRPSPRDPDSDGARGPSESAVYQDLARRRRRLERRLAFAETQAAGAAGRVTELQAELAMLDDEDLAAIEP